MLILKLILKRVAVWLLETLCGCLLLGLFVEVSFVPVRQSFMSDVQWLAFVIGGMSITAGYALTSAIFRMAWNNQGSRMYPVVAGALFLIHSQIFFIAAGGVNKSERWSIQAAGACVVFVCTFLGTIGLRKWEA
jgi:hypothetical protein